MTEDRLSGGAGLFKRFEERKGLERFGQVRKATYFGSRAADRITIVAGDEDDRQPYAHAGETPAHVNAGLAVQIDIHDNAKCPAEIAMIKYGIRGFEQR